MYLVTLQLWAAVWSLQLVTWLFSIPRLSRSGDRCWCGNSPTWGGERRDFHYTRLPRCKHLNIVTVTSQSVPVCPGRRVNNRRTFFRLKLSVVLLLPPLKPHCLTSVLICSLTNIKGNENEVVTSSPTCWWTVRWSSTNQTCASTSDEVHVCK